MAHKHDHLFSNEDFLIDMANTRLSAREVATRWGTSKTFILKHRRNPELIPSQPRSAEPREELTSEYKSDGSRTVEAVRTRPVTMKDAREWISADGDDPEDFDISIRSIAYGIDQFSNKMSATPKKGRSAGPKLPQLDADQIAAKVLAGFDFIPPKRDFLVDVSVLQPTDEQWGKTDFNGGSEQTLERITASYAGFAEYVKEYRPREIVFARTGDGIENFCSANGQRDTNDLDLPHQILALFSADLAGLRQIAPLAERLISAHVPSNHGRWRTGMKADAGDPHADFGIVEAKMLREAAGQFGTLTNVEFVLPEPLMESLVVTTDTGLKLGMVHGHQAGKAEGIDDWWTRQDHGRMPTWDADALFAGHFHSYSVFESGNGRPIFIGPASDNGSSWFSNIRGVRSSSGMLAVSFEGKRWRFQEII